MLCYQSHTLGLFPRGESRHARVRDNVYCASALWALSMAYRWKRLKSYSPSYQFDLWPHQYNTSHYVDMLGMTKVGHTSWSKVQSSAWGGSSSVTWDKQTKYAWMVWVMAFLQAWVLIGCIDVYRYWLYTLNKHYWPSKIAWDVYKRTHHCALECSTLYAVLLHIGRGV